MITDYLSAMWPTITSELCNHLWQSTLFAILAGLLTLFLRKNHARVRYGLWLTASVKFLIPFALLVGFGSHLSWPRSAAPTNAGLYVAMQEVSQPFDQPTGIMISRPISATTAQSLLHSLPKLLAAAWLCGFLVVLFIWCVRWRRISAAVRLSAPINAGREVKMLRQLVHVVGIQKPLEIRLSGTSLEPGIFGVARPILLWPEGISDRLSDAHLEAILAHELWHIRRRDNLAATVHMIVEAVFWFHPVVWWLGSRLVAERERACDEAVLEFGSDRHIYAGSILKICEFCISSPLTFVSGVTGADLKKRIAHIMSERVAHKLDFTRKLLLSTASFLTVGAPIAFGLLHATQTRASSPQITSTPLIAFELASVQPSPRGNVGTTVRFVPGELTLANWTTKGLITYAYNVAADRILGGPSWIDSERYVIDAKVDDSVAYEAENLIEANVAGRFPPGLRHDQLKLMIQSLLEDRFQLRLRREMKQLPVYALVIATNGPKLHEAKPGDSYANGIMGPNFLPAGPHWGAGKNGHLAVQALPMSTVAEILSQQLNRTVVDQTGLTGDYDFTLNWAPNDKEPSIFTAIERQLGLKLESQTASIEVVVIDHAEHPIASPGRTPGVTYLSKPPVGPTSIESEELSNSSVGMLNAAQSRTESHVRNAATVPSVFASVSIKPVSGNLTPGLWFTSDELNATNVTLQMLIKAAYAVEDRQIGEAPSWLNSERYDIKARIDKSVVDAMRPLVRDQRLLQEKRLLQEFLADRFELRLHRQRQASSEYDLIVAENGPRLREAKPGDTYADGLKHPDGTPDGPGVTRFYPGEIIGQAIPMSRLAEHLSQRLGVPVVDRTGLKGTYDVTLKWTPDEKQPPMLVGTSAATIFVSIQRQLGLRLVTPDGPADLLTIDHAVRPSEN